MDCRHWSEFPSAKLAKPTPSRGNVSPEDFRKHADLLRRKGARRVRLVDKTSEHEVEYGPADVPERTPAIGFTSSSEPEEYEEE